MASCQPSTVKNKYFKVRNSILIRLELSIIMTKKRPTMREQLLTTHAYKVGWLIALCELLVVLILPLFKLMYLSVGVLSFHLLSLMDLFTTYFQRKHINFILSLLLGLLVALIICAILFFYITWTSGNMFFVK